MSATCKVKAMNRTALPTPHTDQDDATLRRGFQRTATHTRQRIHSRGCCFSVRAGVLSSLATTACRRAVRVSARKAELRRQHTNRRRLLPGRRLLSQNGSLAGPGPQQVPAGAPGDVRLKKRPLPTTPISWTMAPLYSGLNRRLERVRAKERRACTLLSL